MYYLDEDPTELFTEDQIGDELVFKIIQRFLPNGIDDESLEKRYAMATKNEYGGGIQQSTG